MNIQLRDVDFSECKAIFFCKDSNRSYSTTLGFDTDGWISSSTGTDNALGSEPEEIRLLNERLAILEYMASPSIEGTASDKIDSLYHQVMSTVPAFDGSEIKYYDDVELMFKIIRRSYMPSLFTESNILKEISDFRSISDYARLH